MVGRLYKQLGEPDFQIAGLRLWVLGREFPDSEDYWDGNWLNIHVRVQASGAVVEASGPWLHASELAAFVDGLKRLSDDLTGEASLDCMEPVLRAKAIVGKRGDLKFEVDLTPDNLTQQHSFTFEIDQSHLPSAVTAGTKILQRFPIKGGDGGALA